MSEFFDWLGQLSIVEWYALIFLIEIVFGLTDMFVKERGAEFRQLRDESPDWAPGWADYVVAVLAIVIVAVLWPVFTVIDFVKLVRGVIAWGADKYLNWRTRRWLKKAGIAEEDLLVDDRPLEKEAER